MCSPTIYPKASNSEQLALQSTKLSLKYDLTNIALEIFD